MLQQRTADYRVDPMMDRKGPPDEHSVPPRPSRRRRRRFLFLLAALAFNACADAFLGPDVPDTPVSNFDVLWDDLDRYYALFGDKGVDWDSVYMAFRPIVREEASDEALFDALCRMLKVLRDGHLSLRSADATCIGDRFTGDPEFDLSLRTVERLLEAPFQTAGDGRLRYGRLANNGQTIGYLHIQNFAGDGAPVAGWVRDIDLVLDALSETDALILDVRANGGGNGFNAANLAGRFADRSYPYLISQTRNGADHADLTPPYTWSINPRGTSAYSKRIALLTNRGTFSAAEWFVLALRERPLVTVIGDFTGGGLSSRIFRTLPNGWSFSVSIQRVSDLEGRLYESVGIAPDRQVLTDASFPESPDAILLEAIDFLTKTDRGPVP